MFCVLRRKQDESETQISAPNAVVGLFSVERSARTPVAGAWLANNRVSATVPGPTTHHEVLQALCSSAQRPIPVVTCCEELRSISLPRGYTLHGMAGDVIDQIACNHDGVEWWVTNSGLHIEVTPPASAVPKLSRFDQVAGPMVLKRWGSDSQRRNTKLSGKSLIEIAHELDQHEIEPRHALQPAQWTELKKHNQKAGRAAINTFEKLAKSPKLSQLLRRRMYLAPQRYSKSLETEISPPSYQIPKIFHSYPIY
jgi:hypothetical protein